MVIAKSKFEDIFYFMHIGKLVQLLSVIWICLLIYTDTIPNSLTDMWFTLHNFP